jgi:hypothetical protein
LVSSVTFANSSAILGLTARQSTARYQANSADAASASANSATGNSTIVSISQEAWNLLAASQASSSSTGNGGSQTISSTSSTASASTTGANAAAGTTAGSATSGTIDFTNMTPHQLGNLMKSGVIPASLAPGMLTLTDAQLKIAGEEASGMKVTQSEIDAANNTPANYLQLISNAINEDKAMGMNVSIMQNGLNEMEALQGKSFPSTSTVASPAA